MRTGQRETGASDFFEKQPFGELESLVIQKLLDVVRRVAKEELASEKWLRLVSGPAGRTEL